MLRRIFTIITAAFMLYAACAIVPTAAFAAYSCTANTMCLYTGQNGGGTIYAISQNATGCRTLPLSVRSTTRSIYNNTNYNWHVYQYTTQCTESSGTWATIYAHTTGNMNGEWDRAILGYRRCPC